MSSELGDGPAETRILQLRGHIASRLQHELSSRVPGVRDDEAVSTADELAVKYHIQVDHTRIPSQTPRASEFVFDLLKKRQDFTGRRGRLERGDGIEKLRLTARPADRRRFEQPARAELRLDQRRRRDASRGSGKDIASLAKVAAETDHALVDAARNVRAASRQRVREVIIVTHAAYRGSVHFDWVGRMEPARRVSTGTERNGPICPLPILFQPRRILNPETRERNSLFRFACGFELGIGLIGAILGFLLGADVREYLVRQEPTAGSIGVDVLLGVLAAIPTVLAVWLLMKLPWKSVEELRHFGEQPVIQRLLRLDYTRLILLSLCSGIGEEIAFRGWLFPWLLDFSKSFTAGEPILNADLVPLILAVAVSSVIFGVVHPHTRLYIIITAVMGVYYAGLLIVTDSLLIPMVRSRGTQRGAVCFRKKRIATPARRLLRLGA